MGIDYEINRASSRTFRRAYIRRRDNTTGLYETDWLDITKYVKKWGGIQRSIDDIRLNRTVLSGITLIVRNDEGSFNPETNDTSLWSGYMTRYRTLLKIEGGYYDDSQNELPTVSTLGVFIMNDEIPISAVENTALIKAKALTAVFDEVRISQIPGITGTQTAANLITRIRDYTDGSGNFVFQQFISAGAWTIQAGARNFRIISAEDAGSMSCWSFMQKLAESEGYILLINRSGGLEFRDRDERTTTSQFTFNGLGFPEMNIIKMIEYKEALNKLFTFFRVKFDKDDTLTSYATAGSTTSVDPSSTAWQYGVRQFDHENQFIDATTQAENIASALVNEFSPLKNEITIDAKFCPQLEISDKVEVNYRSYELATTLLWNQFNWDEATFPITTGENFDFNDAPFKILSIKHDLQKFSTTFHLREI